MVMAVNIKGADSLKRMKNPTPEMKNQLKLMHLLSYEPHIKLEALKKIACPTLVIGGDHDVIRTEHTMQIAEDNKIIPMDITQLGALNTCSL
jgi:pimeloyl-ACP methyl ester carboxylesterase